MEQQATEGALRVWVIVNPPNQPRYYTVTTQKEGQDLIDKLAAQQLKQDWIISNAFGMEVYQDGEWTETEFA